MFLVGQSFLPAINDLLLGLLLYRARLIPRTLAILGIVGAFSLIAAYVAMLFGAIGYQSMFAIIAALPVALFELSLGIYFTFIKKQHEI